MPKVLILTGPGGSGKTTIAEAIAEKSDYVYLDGDNEDTEFFPDGNQWLPENDELLRKAHEKILKKTVELHNQNNNVIVDYIIFGLFEEFIDMFESEFGNDVSIKVLLPDIKTLVQRDIDRDCWTTGIERITTVSEEFMFLRDIIGPENYMNNSDQSIEETVTAVLL